MTPGWPSSTGLRLLTIEIRGSDKKPNFAHLTVPKPERMATNVSVT